MAPSFYDISVGTYLQTLGGVIGFLEKGRGYCEANGIDLNEVVETRLYRDMHPFRFQLWAVEHLTRRAWKALEAGRFSPPRPLPPLGFTRPHQLLVDSHAEPAKGSRASGHAPQGGQATFPIGEFKNLC